jgi:hypothetical protein
MWGFFLGFGLEVGLGQLLLDEYIAVGFVTIVSDVFANYDS